MNLTEWANSVNGHYIDRDGAFGAQCHDLWLDYGYRVCGMGAGQGWAPGNGDTVNVLTSFPAVRGLDQHFTRHWGTDGIRAGDVAFWYRSAWFPGSHVAIATNSPRGELLPTMTQNPGPAHTAPLILRGFAGYLRPRNSAAIGAGEEDDMFTDADRTKLENLYAATFKGGPSMVDGGRSIAQSLADLGTIARQPVSRTVDGKVQRIAQIQDNADTNTMTRQLLVQVAALTETVKALSIGAGTDPDAILAAAQEGAERALAGLVLTAQTPERPKK